MSWDTSEVALLLAVHTANANLSHSIRAQKREAAREGLHTEQSPGHDWSSNQSEALCRWILLTVWWEGYSCGLKKPNFQSQNVLERFIFIYVCVYVCPCVCVHACNYMEVATGEYRIPGAGVAGRPWEQAVVLCRSSEGS